jgi:hypothetical protein
MTAVKVCDDTDQVINPKPRLVIPIFQRRQYES